MRPRPFRDHNHAEGEAPQRPPFQNEPVRGAQQGGYGCKNTAQFRIDSDEAVFDEHHRHGQKIEHMHIDMTASVARSGNLLVRVTDTGVGISQKDLTDVFRQFVRAHTDYVAKQEGTGQGLAICKTLVELHGGGIDIDSEFGKGTKMSIVLPGERVLADVVDIGSRQSGRLRIA